MTHDMDMDMDMNMDTDMDTDMDMDMEMDGIRGCSAWLMTRRRASRVRARTSASRTWATYKGV